jgi:hypothetical protein
MLRPMSLRSALRLVAPVVVLGTVTGCPAVVAPPPPTTTDPPRPPLPIDDPDDPTDPDVHGCEVDVVAVPVLPRTSNDEVRRLVEDLTGAAAPSFASWTPLAQVLGFDTMTESRIDAQTLEVQFDTMTTVANTLVRTPSAMAACPAVVDDAPLCALHDHYDATAQFSSTQGQDCWSYLDGSGNQLVFNSADQRWASPGDAGLLIWNTGMHPGGTGNTVRRFTAPLDGAVTLNLAAFDADPGGGDGVNVVVMAAGNVVSRAVIVNGGTADPVSLPLQLRRGDVVDVVVERGGGDNAYDTTGITMGIDFAATLSSGTRNWSNCGALVVNTIASRAWRRPLHADELEEFARLFDDVLASASANGQVGGFTDALSAALTAALLSPNVHYKPELVPGGFADEEAAFRVASRLALYFRGSFPDDELWALAMQNALGDEADIRAQADRLLAANVDRFAEHFAGQWLDFRAPIAGTQTPLQQSMRKEAHDVFVAVLTDGLPPERLLEPGFTVVDGLLAGVYGLPLDAAAGPTRIATAERGGLLKQGHFLTSSSMGSDFKRVIHRGIWTLNRTLCQSVPELDAATREEINASVGAIPAGTPLGEQMQIHRNSTERCIGCHGMMDPLGLSLEAFDSAGTRRSAYADGSSVLNTFDYYDTPLPDPEALSTFLTSSTEYRSCVAEKLLTFGLHRAPTGAEYCVVNALAADEAGNTRALRDMALDAFIASLKLTEER